jgi:hypothetical protein
MEWAGSSFFECDFGNGGIIDTGAVVDQILSHGPFW